MKKSLLFLVIAIIVSFGKVSTAKAQQYDTIAQKDLPDYLKNKSGEVTVVINNCGDNYSDGRNLKLDYDGKLNLIYAEGLEEIVLHVGNLNSSNNCLKSISLPQSAKSVSGFEYCLSLSDVKFDRKYISLYDFTKREEKKNGYVQTIYHDLLELPEDATNENTLRICFGSFIGCPLQKSVYKAEGEISGHKFFNYDNYTKEIVVPGYITGIKGNYFEGIQKLEGVESITFEAAKDSSVIGAYYRDDDVEHLEIKCKLIVGNCPNLKRIIFPENTLYIGGIGYLPKLESIELPSNLKFLAAINECPSLKTIKLPENINSTVINANGKYSMPNFYSNELLESVNIPKNVEIGYYLFNDFPNWDYDDYTNSFYVFGTFSNCKSLKSIEIPEGVTYIGDVSFFNCESLTSIKLPSTLRAIGNHAFAHCKSLETIELPENLERIGEFAFEGCQKLTNINIPKSVSNDSIGKGAFWACPSLKQNLEPNKIIVDSREFEYWDKDIIINFTEEIPEYYFKNFTSLKSVIITQSDVNIKNEAFADCINLESIISPVSTMLKCEYDQKFNYYYCNHLGNLFSLKSITNFPLDYDSNYFFDNYFLMHNYLIHNNILFGYNDFYDTEYYNGDIYRNYFYTPSCIKNKKAKFYVRDEFIDLYYQRMDVVNDSLVVRGYDDKYEYEFLSIDEYYEKMAANWTNGETVIVPEGVTFIPCSLFEGISTIKKVILPQSLKVISERAFAYCNNLTEVKGAENLVAIYDSAFKSCTKLKKIKIPQNTVLGKDALKDCIIK